MTHSPPIASKTARIAAPCGSLLPRSEVGGDRRGGAGVRRRNGACGAVILAAAGVMAAIGGGARVCAGTIPLYRESVILARTTGGDGVSAAERATDFNAFAETVEAPSQAGGATGGGGGASGEVSVEANQYSTPGVMDAALDGAFAEGSVSVKPASGPAEAVSRMGLWFRVAGTPSRYAFAAAAGAVGTGQVLAELRPVASSESIPPNPADPAGQTPAPPVFADRILPGAGDSWTIEHTGLLEPGNYVMEIAAQAADGADESSAYYNISLTLGPGGVAIPLPPALWPGLASLAAPLAWRECRRIARRAGRCS